MATTPPNQRRPHDHAAQSQEGWGVRGRPPVTRARVLTYWRKHGPCPIMQIVRATGAERSYVKRVMLRNHESFSRISRMELTEEERAAFEEKVDRALGFGPNGDCWIWRGAIGATGYPRHTIGGKHFQASHVALALAGSPRPSSDLLALHSCDHKLCVNPAHLRWGTDAENSEDHRQRGRRGRHWLPDEIVHEIHQSSETNKNIADRLGLTPAAVCNIRKGRAHRGIYEQYYPVP